MGAHELQKLAWEMTGTFFLCFTITTGAHNTGASMPALPLAIGWTLAIMVYAGGPVSGGHYNPAVTLGCALRGAIAPQAAVNYAVAQLLGALLAGGFGVALRGEHAGYPRVSPAYSGTTGGRAAAFFAEFFYTTALVFTVLSVATAKATRGNNYFGLAIGSVVFVGAATAGGISGAALNPAVGIGLPAVNGHFEWIYAVAPFLGAVAAWAVFSVTHVDDRYEDPDGGGGGGGGGGDSAGVVLWCLAGSGEATDLQASAGRYLTEFVGTFYLCLTVGLAVDSTNGANPIEGLAIGAILMIFVYAGGHVSGGHYNPAVTLGAWLAGKMEDCDVSFSGCVRPLGYACAQIVGGCVAAGVANLLMSPAHGEVGYPRLGAGKTGAQGALAEATFTFALVSVVLFTVCSSHSKGNSYFGFCVGMTIFCGATAVGPISGGAFNPAVGTALPSAARHTRDVWMYWVGPIFGSVAAVAFYRVANPDFDLPDRFGDWVDWPSESGSVVNVDDEDDDGLIELDDAFLDGYSPDGDSGPPRSSGAGGGDVRRRIAGARPDGPGQGGAASPSDAFYSLHAPDSAEDGTESDAAPLHQREPVSAQDNAFYNMHSP